MNKEKINWFNEPQEHDYPAALSYLTLFYDEYDARKIVKRLRKAPMTAFKAKDVFRASQLSLLGVSNSHLQVNRKKIENGEMLSPILLVRDSARGRVVIADGYHRMCGVYTFDEDAVIPAKIVSDDL